MSVVILYDNEQDSFPRSTTGSGTITSVNNKTKIVGSGSSFLTEARVGDYIYIKAQSAFRKIIEIQTATELFIDRAFASNVSASAYRITPRDCYSEISAAVVDTGAAVINGVTFAQNQVWTDSKSSRDNGARCVDPMDINATGTKVRVTSQFG